MRQKGYVLDMAATKTNQNIKREKKAEKRRKIDKITNWFMISMSWGILLIIILLYMQNTLVANPKVLIIPGIIFALAAGALFVLAKINLIKNVIRAYNNAVFTLVLAVGSFLIAFYPRIRLVVGTSLDSRFWVTWAPITIIIAYLAVAFVLTSVGVARVERKK